MTFTTPSNGAIFDFIYRVYGAGLSTAAYDVWFSQLQLEQKDHVTFYADQFQPDCTATDATEAQTWLDAPATRITANVLQAKYDLPVGNTFRGKLVGLLETGYTGRNRIIVDQRTADLLPAEEWEHRRLPARPVRGFGLVEPLTIRRR